MNGSPRECEEIALRLVGGERPSDDAALASHVGTCLRCFRVASEIRDVPRIAALLRAQEPPESADPGEAFWARFPSTLGAAFEQRRATPAVPLREERRISAWQRVTSWFRLPIPAAFGGAAVAAALALVLVHSPPQPPVTVVPAPQTIAAEGDDEDGAPALLEDEDPWTALEMADARSVARVRAGAKGSEPSKTVSDEGMELAASPAEELEMLDPDDLRAVAQALRGGAI